VLAGSKLESNIPAEVDEGGEQDDNDAAAEA